ncbi:CCR4-NOT transcription complex subunit 10-like [Nilaparvata lugens]|uniref:CCR4-NOT transcription complex subunit 10-like n=1 Tax=Nilaparvata lugens TaxID=108931 RepID=UPI00193DA7EE|nr:CCR4-NOT transcription complex subunit 10-like [Nilaparvata lugens]
MMFLSCNLYNNCKLFRLVDLLFDLNHIARFLGHVYAGEALILLDRIQEAIDHLNPERCPDMNAAAAATRPLRPWCPQTTDTARSVLQYNLAVALVVSGRYEKAGDLLKQVWQSTGGGSKNNVPIHVIALAMYVELLLGHADVARTIVKQNCMQSQR